MSQIRNRNSQLQADAGDTLPMGAFRPNPSWFEEHWLTEAQPTPPGVIRRSVTRLVEFAGALVKRWLSARRSAEHMPIPAPQAHLGALRFHRRGA